MKNTDYAQALLEIRKRDDRYQTQAYLFAAESLEFTIQRLLNLTPDKRRHVTAKELVEGMRKLAIEKFGYMARPVWESWGIYSTTDWGNIIFNLIDHSLMQANDNDKREDFEGIFDFEQVFDRQWTFKRQKNTAT